MRIKVSLAVCGVLTLLGVATGASSARVDTAQGANAARLAWNHHPGAVKRGHTVVIALDRATRAACSLTIAATDAGSRTFGYAEGSGPIQFAISPSRRTRLGVWHLTAVCVPLGRVNARRLATTVVVTGSALGSGFLVGKSGPAYQVPVGFGAVNKIASIPTGGRGGDPGNDYPWANVRQDSGVDPWGEDYRECTSFVAWALHSRNEYNMPFHDDAYNWGIDAEHLGIPVNNTPTVGSVAWEPRLPGHYWGHVMWVAAVNGSTVTVEEYNEHGNGTYDERTFNVHSEPYQYIHFKDLGYSPPAVPAPAPTTNPPAGGTTYAETTGSLASTWTNYSYASGTQGPSVGANQTVAISCKVQGFPVADGNSWWYQIASSPWDDSYYVSADAFYNNGATSGSLRGTPFVDNSVPDCGGGSTTPTPMPTPTPTPTPTPAPPTYPETTGSVAHTWTNYSNAGGTEGPEIGSNQTVQIACKVTGFRVSDGNTWWYRIASSPWNGSYYVSADAFYNDGQTSGSLQGTPFVDPNVPNC